MALEFNWSSPLVVDEPRPRPPIVLPILNELTALWAAAVRSLTVMLLSGEFPSRFKTLVKSEAGAAAAIDAAVKREVCQTAGKHSARSTGC